MSPVGRSWLAFAAVGAGLIHLALAIGSPAASAGVFAAIGIVEFGWGLVTMAAPRVYLPRVALVAALVPTAFWVVAILASAALRLPQLASSLRVLPLLAATVLELGIAALLAIGLRRGIRTTPPSAGRFVLGVAAGAVIIAAITVAALAGTQAGQIALPPGTFETHGGH